MDQTFASMLLVCPIRSLVTPFGACSALARLMARCSRSTRKKANSLVECRVADNGCGTSGARPGRGLMIVETLAEAMGGRIEHFSGAESTMAVLIFPRCAQAGTTPQSYLSAIARQTGSDRRFLG